jgi:hypothetical protein
MVSARDPVPEHAVVSAASSAATPTSDMPGFVVNVDSLFIGNHRNQLCGQRVADRRDAEPGDRLAS